jgi:hypothetical protein
MLNRWGIQLHLDYLDNPTRFFADQAGKVYSRELQNHIPTIGEVTLGRSYWMLGAGFSYRLSKDIDLQSKFLASISPERETFNSSAPGTVEMLGTRMNIGEVDVTHKESGSILALQSDLYYNIASTLGEDVRFLTGGGIGFWYFTPGTSILSATPRQFPQYQVTATTDYTGFAVEVHPMAILDLRVVGPVRLGVGGGVSIGYSSMWTTPQENPIIKLKPERYNGIVLSPRVNASISYTF